MRSEIEAMLKRAPRPDSISTTGQVAEFKRLHKEVTKKMAKKLTQTELLSIYQQVARYYT